MSKKLKLFSLLLFPLSIIINTISSRYPYFIEKYYSNSINKFTVETLSKISSIVPFSIFEILIYLAVLSILLLIIYFIYSIINNPKSLKTIIKDSLLNILSIISVVYFLFIILWGLNYNRLPLEVSIIDNYNLKYNKSITKVEKNNEDLINLYKYLIEKSNDTRKLVKTDSNIFKANTDYKGIIKRAPVGYENITELFPNISGNYKNTKYILSSNIMCYTGITGIYSPFTGEANVNIAVPDLYLPSTVLHEMAHQRGYASEDEANFIAYLASINHPDIDFKYSGYILALNHTANALYKADYKNYVKCSKNISEGVLNDLRYNNEFWDKYEGKIDEISNNINNTYLKANGVSEGVKSYGKMVDLLLTFYNLYTFNN
ncbi:DUF3810 domain-containing protein [Romboutsia sp. 13368]|uniref:DUF3810 domain-containing protein n=1 Tax=Romboutsia sp. 13368 TaxID=2708053 RepID=UPI0025D788EF|nr:DUF3810 domain-containing protein [Romboutsia sp. 13368]